MSQTWASTAISLAAGTWAQNAADKFDTLRTLNSGATAPSSTTPYMLWMDTTTGALKQRNAADSAWVVLIPVVASTGGGLLPLTGGTMSGIINMGSQRIEALAAGTATTHAPNIAQVDTRIRSATVHVGTISASDEKYIFITQDDATTITDVEIVSENGVAADGANKWTFQVRDLTAAADLLSAVKDTSAAAITADTRYALGVNQNNSALAAAKVLELQMTKTGSPNNLQEMLVVVKYTVTTL